MAAKTYKLIQIWVLIFTTLKANSIENNLHEMSEPNLWENLG